MCASVVTDAAAPVPHHQEPLCQYNHSLPRVHLASVKFPETQTSHQSVLEEDNANMEHDKETENKEHLYFTAKLMVKLN